jgi:hypothetical protein
MAATRSRPGRTARTKEESAVTVKAKEAGGAVASAARRAPAPAITAGAAAAGLAGGLVIGLRAVPRRAILGLPHPSRTKVLGVRVGRRHRPSSTARALAGGARRVAAAAGKASNTADDIRVIREHLELANRRSPIEVVLEGLTHRRGAHNRER